MVEDLISSTVPLIHAADLKSELNSDTPPVVLDAREKKEFDVSHLNGAIWVGYDDFRLDRVKAEKDGRVVVYCSVGYRSEKIGEKLKKAGYSNVFNLFGGIFKWKNSAYPLVDDTGSETDYIHAYDADWGKWLVKGKKVYD